MLAALPEDRYEVRDVLIDRRGMWYARGLAMEPARALAQSDIVLSALHGGIGEDGTVQRIAAKLHIPFVGSHALPSALSLNKVRARQVLQEAGILLPRAVSFSIENELTTEDMTNLVFSQFGPPYVVKPPAEGASAGIRVVATVLELPDTLADTLESYGGAIVEEYVVGSEAVVGIIEAFRNESLYALPPAYAERPEGELILPHYFRISGAIRHLAPSHFSHEEKRGLETIARQAHAALGLSHYSSADFILSRRGPVLLEVDAHPHLHPSSAFHTMLEAVGSSVGEFLEHAFLLARRA